jgi:hypothetical protein
MRPSSDPEMPLIVTGADEPHWRSLWQLLRSAERASAAPSFRWLVYDLGLSPAARERIQRDFPWIALRHFEFDKYPPHVAMSRGGNAWKPIIIAEVLDEHGAPMFWLDCDTIITSDLREPLEALKRLGVVSLRGTRPVGERCDPGVIEALNAERELLHLPERMASFIGFHPGFVIARGIARDWARHALVEDRIMPPDAAADHPGEQAILSVLLHRAEAQCLLTLNDECADAKSERATHWVTTCSKVKASMPLWADGAVRTFHRWRKTRDQLVHRLKDWERRQVGGAERRYREHYEVSVQLAHQPPVAIRSPNESFYADPFPLRVSGRNYLLVTEHVYNAARARLVCLILDEALGVTSAQPVLPLQRQASFPYTFTFGGRAYLTPDTPETRSVDLYRVGATPWEWTLKRRLLYGVDAAGTVIVRRGEFWWVITSVLKPGAAHRHLEIHYARDLLEDELKPHPVNAEKRYQNHRYGTGRNAGSYLRTPQGLVRPMQSSVRYSGEGLKLMLLKALDPERFEEVPVAMHTAYSDVVDMLSPHHVSQNGELLAWDVRDRAR